ncbi:MAG: alanine racemase [Candidatus Pacearchaeota archaeon]
MRIGTPVFVFDERILKKNYKELYDICKKNLKNFKIAYSVKTNSYKGVIKTLDKLNCDFEVASLEEAKKISLKRFVIFNGCAKKEEELKFAIKNNFLINVDSFSEINKLYKISKNKKLNVGIRVSLKETKFGFEKESLKKAIEYARLKNMNTICIHCHAGTQLKIKEYEEYIKKLSEIIENLRIKIRYIDIGGGLPDKFQLKNLNLKLENYIEIIKKNLSKFNCTIILEPGRYLVADSFFLLTKVVLIKENFRKKYAILDSGINLLPKITLSKYIFSKLSKKDEKEKKEVYILAGPLLFSNDILGFYEGNLKEGDILKVENVGAYCYNLSWDIIYKKPKILNIKNLNI